MTRKKKKTTTAARAARRNRGPEYTFTGSIAAVSGSWHAIYFEADEDDGVDLDTVTTLPIACWAACLKGSDPLVGGMVAGPDGLELAELDASFRGYIPSDEQDDHTQFIDLWEEENGHGDEEGEEDEEEGDED